MKKRTYLVKANEKMGSQELAEFFTPSQAIVISNEQGGGEEDADDVDWAPIALTCGSSKSSPPISQNNDSSNGSPESKASQNSSRTSTEKRKSKNQFRLPVSEKEDVDGDEGEEDDVRSNSPVIRAYLEDRVYTANDDLLGVDSLRNYCEEGSEDSEIDSLSSACYQLNSDGEEEEYTLERLQAAGPPLSSLAPLLKHVLHSTAEISTRASPSNSDNMLTSYTFQP